MKKNHNISTELVHLSRPKIDQAAPVNPTLMRASTVLFPSHAAWENARGLRKDSRVLSYGARGTETHFQLEHMIAQMEGGAGAQLLPTGLAALSAMILTLVSHGDHIIVTDGVYAPIRNFCLQAAKKFGFSVNFSYADASDVEEKIQPNTKLVLAESPSSLLYELIDMPKLAKVTKRHNIPLAVDNTYGSGYLYNPIKLGADISIIAATKYLGGHSDIVMGIITANEEYYPRIKDFCESFGLTTSADDAYMVLRGIRTLAARMRMHEQNTLAILDFLQTRDEVKTLYHPALKTHPLHDIWKRDFSGSNGLLTIEFHDQFTKEDIIGFVDKLSLFSIGASWGGFESLATYITPSSARSRTNWHGASSFVRLHVGLEDPQDLIDDLTNALTYISEKKEVYNGN